MANYYVELLAALKLAEQATSVAKKLLVKNTKLKDKIFELEKRLKNK